VTDEELLAAAALGTPPEPPTGEVAPRRRAGGRAGHERSLLPPQRPWKQPRMPYEPVRVVSDDEL
jgi:hypothetical protein